MFFFFIERETRRSPRLSDVKSRGFGLQAWPGAPVGFKGRPRGHRLVSVNMVCSFLTVLNPLTVSTNSSSSMN
ncbi:hypothetical protein EYF80_061382 [Liparis tanakae]|uniref:Uncharacterized protein n=1 Tax=Liparis tanakae TaxID=230148 RepID=A0A4Z2EIS3_9TELE|nr:hypothetical protein EYF80_061382 [Liparis tanakae]